MRVLRTDMYFSRNDVRPIQPFEKVPENPGLSFAYFNLRQFDYISQSNDLDEWVYDASIEGIFDSNDSHGMPSNSHSVLAFLSLAITEHRGRVTSDQFRNEIRLASNANIGIADFALNAGIVIENSPPSLTTLSKALQGSPNIVLGTYTGMAIAGDSYPLMLVTIPAGIIIFGAAVGVSKGLQNGLNKSVEAWVKKKVK